MKKMFSILVCVLLFQNIGIEGAEQSKISPDAALKRLIEGNSRFMQDKLEHPDRTSERREALVFSQSPFATIVGCSDSRVSPEIIFDQGVGDLFIVRVAGNVIGNIEAESIDYAVLYLKSSVILVLGHESCGAVDAVMHGQTKDIHSIAKIISPSIVKTGNMSGEEKLASSIRANAINMRDYLRKHPALKKLIEQNQLKIEAGYYYLQSGQVELL